MKRLSIVMLLLFHSSVLGGDEFLFDNGVGGAANVQNGIASDDKISVKQADNFTPDSDVLVNEIQWSGRYGGPVVVDNFSIQFYADDGGNLPLSPAVIDLAIGSSAQRTQLGTSRTYAYSATIEPLLFEANETVWLSITNDTPGSPLDPWFWGSLNFADNDRAFSRDSGETWTASTSNMQLVDFRIIGETVTVAVPEPQVSWIFAIFLPWLLASRKRNPVAAPAVN